MRYDPVQKTLHWLIALGVIIMLIFGPGLHELDPELRIRALKGHSGIGLLLLVLMLLRLAWRLTHRQPALPAEVAEYQRRIAGVVHWAFYVLVPLQAIFGMAQAAFMKAQVAPFGLFDISRWAAPDEGLAELFHHAHGINGLILLVLVCLHAGAALYHHFYQRDDVLKRMLPFARPEAESGGGS